MERSRYRLEVSPEVAQLMRDLHPGLKRKLRASLDRIARDASAGKALRAELEGLRSFRVARFRIVYRPPVRQAIQIVAIGPRAGIYEETLRLLSRGSRGK